MEIQYNRMIIFGTITAVVYIIVPLIVMNVLSGLQIIDFKPSFQLTLIILGIFSVILTIVKNIFSKGTIIGNSIGIASSIFSGIYAFYLFGGFSPEKTWGSYQIITENFIAFLGLQLIAWLLLLGAIVRSLSSGAHLIENVRGKKKKREKERKLQAHQVFTVIGLGITIFMLGYLGTVIFSGTNIGLNVKDNNEYSYENSGTAPLGDDKINITVFFDLHNYGFYSILDVVIDADIYTIGTTDPFQTSLPNNTKIGEVDKATYRNFPPKQTTYNEELIVSIDSKYVPGLITYDANLSLQIYFSTYYAGIFIDFYINQTTYWDSGLIP